MLSVKCYITELAENDTIIRMFWEGEKRRRDRTQLITFARCRREALPIKYRDLPSAAFNQKPARSNSLDRHFVMVGLWTPSIFGEQVLSDREDVASLRSRS